MIFVTPTEAFEHLCFLIAEEGESHLAVKASWTSVYNVGFTILKPNERIIKTPWRNFKPKYAELEWQWYLTKDPNPAMVAKEAKLWDRIRNQDGTVNSNYGYWWSKEDQLTNIIKKLSEDKHSRQAWVTIYDGKLFSGSRLMDIPCTLSIGFRIRSISGEKDRLDMTVLMRSNDLWWGFCIDQYCFSKLQELVAQNLDMRAGEYHHFAADLHLYDDKLHKYVQAMKGRDEKTALNQ